MNNIALETIIEKWKSLCAERDVMVAKFQAEIDQLENAIELLTGGNPNDAGFIERYDDESPDYIRGTEDGV